MGSDHQWVAAGRRLPTSKVPLMPPGNDKLSQPLGRRDHDQAGVPGRQPGAPTGTALVQPDKAIPALEV
jgi:hypothetical protein